MAAEVLDAAQAPTIEDARRAAAIAAADRRVEQVLVFGSVARDQAGRQSDIDLLVLLGEVSPEDAVLRERSR